MLLWVFTSVPTSGAFDPWSLDPLSSKGPFLKSGIHKRVPEIHPRLSLAFDGDPPGG